MNWLEASNATVVLAFQPLPEHVRTARLVAVASARQSGLPDFALDEVRLVIGELCGRAVRRSLRNGVDQRLTMEIFDSRTRLVYTIVDHAAEVDADQERIALTLVRTLADEVRITSGPGGEGGSVTVTWLVNKNQ